MAYARPAMTSGPEREFLAAIVAAPADDAPRLAYAAWLRGRGDPRGEFIEVQCELAALARGERSMDDGSRLYEAHSRLEQAHEFTWTEELRALLGVTGQHNYHPARLVRGFVEELIVPADVLVAEAPRIAALAPLLRKISLGRPRVGALDGALARALAGLRELAAITELRLFFLDLDDDAFVPLARSPHLAGLVALDLGANRLGPASVEALLAAPFAARLTTLELWKNDVGDEGAVRIAAAAPPGIRGIRLEHNGVGPRGAVALAGAARLAGLEVLQLSHSAIGDEGVCALVESAALVGLRHLDVYEVGLSLAGLRRVVESPGLARIESLAIGGNAIGDAGLSMIADSPHTGGLVRLDLEGSEIGDAGMQALARARGLDRLFELGLRYNRITDVGAAALAATTRLPALVELDLAYNDIFRESMERWGGANMVGQGMREELR